MIFKDTPVSSIPLNNKLRTPVYRTFHKKQQFRYLLFFVKEGFVPVQWISASQHPVLTLISKPVYPHINGIVQVCQPVFQKNFRFSINILIKPFSSFYH